ncbi:MAG TPA: polyprenyl synthetase family protein [Vicinamibacteria bacterium]|jgi:octaprenyl-diphosphate synthase|nr:polyprenyl synthetase family protein [Vicinamibacteria bacterium]
MTLRDIVSIVEHDLAAVEVLLEEQLRSGLLPQEDVGHLLQERGERRLHPALLLLGCGLTGYNGDRAAPLGVAVELIHTATRLHDGIIGEVPLRAACRLGHRWGKDLTVLLGDFLQVKWVSMALSQDDLRIPRLLLDVTLRIVEGQILDRERYGDPDVPEADHLDIVRRKSADLFSACLRIGGILGNVGEEREHALASYGLNVGMCLQVVDDILDFTAHGREEGRAAASSLGDGRVTLPAIYLMRRAGARGIEAVSTILRDRAFDHVSREEIVSLVREHGALDQATAAAERYAESARQDLGAFGPSSYREALERVPHYILSRHH